MKGREEGWAERPPNWKSWGMLHGGREEGERRRREERRERQRRDMLFLGIAAQHPPVYVSSVMALAIHN